MTNFHKNNWRERKTGCRGSGQAMDRAKGVELNYIRTMKDFIYKLVGSAEAIIFPQIFLMNNSHTLRSISAWYYLFPLNLSTRPIKLSTLLHCLSQNVCLIFKFFIQQFYHDRYYFNLHIHIRIFIIKS
jgi:hypothetical protein